MSDTNSQNNSAFVPTQNKESSWSISKLCLIAFSIIFFYCISFGPMLFLIIKTENYMKNSSINRGVDGIFQIVFTPHFKVAKYSEIYFDYTIWWVELAGEKMLISYEEFRNTN